MSDLRSIIEVVAESGLAPNLPKRLEPAIKFVLPDFTTYNGFSWWGHGKWVNSPDDFSPITCVAGGLHVANTIAAAQSGGGRYTNCLWVGVDPAEAGSWVEGKRKAPRVCVAGPIDLLQIIRSHGAGAHLAEAVLVGANLRGADLTGADLSRANLRGAYLRGADLRAADLRRAYLRGADLSGAYLRGADLSGAYLRAASGRTDWDDLVERGAIR